MPNTVWTFNGPISLMPEPAAPRVGKASNTVSMALTVPQNANGVLYAIGDFGGGLSCCVKDGVLNCEYNLFMMSRTEIVATEKLPTGSVNIDVEERFTSPRPGGPLDVTMKVNGKVVARGQVPITGASCWPNNDGFNIDSDLGSSVSVAYCDAAPFKFNGTIGATKIACPKPWPSSRAHRLHRHAPGS